MHTIVPRGFPAESDSARLSPKFPKIKGGLAKELKDLGVLECVNVARRLWKWTQSTNTDEAIQVNGGKLSLSVSKNMRESMAFLMARHAA